MTAATGLWLSGLALAQSGEAQPGGSGLTFAFGLGLAAACVVLVWTILQLRNARTRLAALTVEHRSTTEAHRALLDKERKQAKALDGKRDNVKDLKLDLASAKKKNHTLQEELKEVRRQLKEQSEAKAAARKTRPAFSEPTAAKAEPKAAAPAAKPAPAPVEAAKPQPAPRDDSRLQGEIDRLSATLAEERDKARNQRGELARLKRRAEDQRRIDVITKGQQSSLEDRVRTLGRQYYDAVSEVAVLKGEVKPPPPRDLAAVRAFVAGEGSAPTAADSDAGDQRTDETEGTHENATAGSSDAREIDSRRDDDGAVHAADATDAEPITEQPPAEPELERDQAPEVSG